MNIKDQATGSNGSNAVPALEPLTSELQDKKQIQTDKMFSISPPPQPTKRIQALVARLDAFCQKHALLDPNLPILIALSGGADSVFLLYYLQLRTCRLTALHVNHMLRGPQAERDARFCQMLCSAWNIPFVCVTCNVSAQAKQTGESTETTARMMRYEALGDFCDTQTAQGQMTPRIAAAHHADDQAETILMHLLRGSDLRGSCGMRPTRWIFTPKGLQTTLIRPFLCLRKEEILYACRTLSLPYVTDETNDSTAYTRNRVRRALAPLCANDFCGYPSALCRFSDAAARDEDYFTIQTEHFMRTHAQVFPGTCRVPRCAVADLHPALATRILRSMYQTVAKEALRAHPAQQLQAWQIEQMLQKTTSFSHPCQLSLPHSVTFLCYDDHIIITSDRVCPSQNHINRVQTLHLGNNPLTFTNGLLILEKVPKSHDKMETADTASVEKIYKLSICAHLNFATLKYPLSVVPRSALAKGTTYLLRGMHRKIKNLLSEQRIPQSLRADFPAIVDADGTLLWIPCCPPADPFRASGTEDELEIRCFLQPIETERTDQV